MSKSTSAIFKGDCTSSGSYTVFIPSIGLTVNINHASNGWNALDQALAPRDDGSLVGLSMRGRTRNCEVTKVENI